jgi:hypothetical protein
VLPRVVTASRGIRFDSQSVVDGTSELLLASERPLSRLDGDVPEQELDLIQFAAREVAETGEGARRSCGANFVNSGTLSAVALRAPQRTQRQPLTVNGYRPSPPRE